MKSSKKYFAELKCSPDIVDLYYQTKSNSAFIAAKISRIDDCSMFVETDSIDGNMVQFNLGKSILLSEGCLTLLGTLTAKNAD